MARSRPDWIKLWMLAMAGLLLVAIVVTVVMANPSLPELPELDKVSLDLPEVSPPSAKLASLLEEKLAASFDGADNAVIKDALEALRKGRWIDTEAEHVLGVLAKLDDPSLPGLREALLAPGCLPLDQPAQSRSYSYIPLLKGVRLLVVEAVARAQLGQARESARDLFAVHDRLLEMEQRCSSPLIPAIVLSSALGVVNSAWGFWLASGSGLDPSLRQGIWSRIKALETRPCPLPDAFRHEGRWIRSVLDDPDAEQKGDSEPIKVWPWYDREQTLELFDLLAKRRVWLASQTLDSKEWSRTFPEEEWLEKLREQPNWFTFFRYNGTGKVLVAIAAPSYRNMILRWHQQRCLSAGRRARWLHDLAKRGHEDHSNAAAGQPAPLDPFTKKRFEPLLPKGPICAIPTHLNQNEPPKLGEPVPPLPSPRAISP
jgi:hypothetical protein